MLLFTRRVVVNPGQIRAGMAHALEILEFVNEKTELDVSLYQVLQGAPLGTLTFAFQTESYSASVEATDALVQSDEYLDKVEAGAKYFVGNPEDRLAEFLHVAGKVSGPPAAASVVSATLEVSRASSAISWAIELANYTNNLTAQPMAVLMSNLGQYGTVSWLGYGQSLATLEEAGKKTNADPGFIQRLGDSQGLFVTGSGRGVLSRKIG
jgi:hypothetical protein